MFPEYILILAFPFTFGIIWYYLRQISSNKIQPNLVTWGIWTLTTGLSLLSSLDKERSLVLLFSNLNSLFVCFSVFALTLIQNFRIKKYHLKFTSIEIICLILSLFGVLAWWIWQDSIFGFVASCLAIIIGSVPNIFQAYKKPENDSYFGYLSGTVAGLLTILTIKNFTVFNMTFPIIEITVNFIIIGFIELLPLYKRFWV